MRIGKFLFALTASSLAGLAHADHSVTWTQTFPPAYERVYQPHRECQTEVIRSSIERDAFGNIIKRETQTAQRCTTVGAWRTVSSGVQVVTPNFIRIDDGPRWGLDAPNRGWHRGRYPHHHNWH